MMTRPHALNPKIDSVRALIVYKNFAAAQGISHIGLGVAAMHNSQVLRQSGTWVDVSPTATADDVDKLIQATDAQALKRGEIPVSHVVVSAPWIATTDWMKLISKYPQIDFACVSHSNVAFLHADANGVKLLREGMDLQKQYHNFTLAANSRKFCDWAFRSYGTSVTWLPNLYNLGESANRHTRTRPAFSGGTLRIGSFGAVRILKNHVTAAAAALEIAARLGVETEFWMSFGRAEGAGSALSAITQLTQGVKNFTVKTNTWETWAQFTSTVRSMHLLLQPSFTESFNMVTADGVSQGVPSVVSDAIEWVPGYWQASADDALDIANKGVALLFDPVAASEGWEALERHNASGKTAWQNWLVPTISS